MEKIIKPQVTESVSHHFLTGAILFANLDYSGLSAYAIKAIVGGAIWMGFKLAGDYISHKLIGTSKSKKSEQQHTED